MRVLIVAGNISQRMGGEAANPLQYFRRFRARGVEAWCACHARVRAELKALLTEEEFSRFTFVEDDAAMAGVFRLGKFAPERIADLVVSQGVHFLESQKLRRVVKHDLVPRLGIDVVFEPAPITPKGVSHLYDVGAPVVIGPMCGGLSFPPAFAYMDSRFARLGIATSRAGSGMVHRLVPGKLRADALLVANPQTAAALPGGARGRVYEVVESGVELNPDGRKDWDATPPHPRPTRFIYVGRFVDWKGVDLLVKAFCRLSPDTPAVLDLVGDGPLRSDLERQVAEAKVSDRVQFRGWLSRAQVAATLRESDVFTMPSLRECGGTAILEAMAVGLPVICAHWAGPGRYVNDATGIRVPVETAEGFIAGLSAAMEKLAGDPALCRRLGEAGPARVATEYFDWESKTTRVLEVLEETVRGGGEVSPEAQGVGVLQ